jgi:hypothetical protein
MTKLQYLNESSNNNWYTPKKYIESAKKVFDGEIDFDPFSCNEANLTIQAKLYFTKNDDAFLLDWPNVKSMWCNPPYERRLINKSIDAVIAYASNMTVDAQIIMVVNSSTDASWYQKLLKHCSAMCFTNHRIQFFMPIQGTGNREQGTGNREQGTGNREQGTGNR